MTCNDERFPVITWLIDKTPAFIVVGVDHTFCNLHKGKCEDYSRNKALKEPEGTSSSVWVFFFLLKCWYVINVFSGCGAQHNCIAMLYNRSTEFSSDAQWRHFSEWTSRLYYKGLSTPSRNAWVSFRNNWRYHRITATSLCRYG